MNKINKQYLIYSILFAIIYFIFAKLGLFLATIHQNASPVWPASGIAVCILGIVGYRFWPSIFIAALLVNYLEPTPFFISFGIATGNTLEALLGG